MKIKRIHGLLRLELRREPFSHWLLVFQHEPLVDLEIKSYVSDREAAHVSDIIGQLIRRAVRRKHVWPSYKIRYRPFFPTSKRPVVQEGRSVIDKSRIPGNFHVTIQSCNRLSVPYEIFAGEQYASLFIFVTVSINERTCEDYFRTDRERWITYELKLQPDVHKIQLKEVAYMDRVEVLVEQLQPMPDRCAENVVLRDALEEKNVFLLQVQGVQVTSLSQGNLLLKSYSKDRTEPVKRIVVGIPILQNVRVPRAAVQETMAKTLTRTFSLPRLPSFKDEEEPTVTARRRSAGMIECGWKFWMENGHPFRIRSLSVECG